MLAPAQGNHDPAKRVEHIFLLMQIVEKEGRHVYICLLVEDIWVKDTVCSYHADQLIFICFDHDSFYGCSDLESIPRLVVSDLII